MAPRDPAADPQLARARMTLLAAELARRSTKEHLQAEALAAAEDLKARATVMARAKATEVKDDIKQRAHAATIGRVQGAFADASRSAGGLATDIKEQVMGTRSSSIVGAVAGATAGVVMARALEKRRGTGLGMEGRIRETVEGARVQAEMLRERVPSMDEVRAGTGGLVHQAVEEQPLLLALGALVLGGIAGLLVPVTEAERRAFEPIKSKAVEGVQKLGDVLTEQLDGGARQPQQGEQAPSFVAHDDRAESEETLAYASQLADAHELDDVPEEIQGERPRGILDDLSHSGGLH